MKKLTKFLTTISGYEEGDQRHLIIGIWCMWIVAIVFLFSKSALASLIVAGVIFIGFIVWEILQKTGNTLQQQVEDVLKSAIPMLPLVFIIALKYTDTL